MTVSIQDAESLNGDKEVIHQESLPSYVHGEKPKDWNDTAVKAMVATTDSEHTMTGWEAFRLYKKAVGWSLIVSAAVIMEGYDTALLGALYGFPAFQKQFGQPYGDGYEISAAWQTALSMGTNIGVVIGVFVNGIMTERLGHKRMMLISLATITMCIFVPFFSTTAPVLFVGEVLCGIPWGVFSTLAPAYASEVCPVALRGYLTTYVNLCWVTGQLIASGVLDSLQGRNDEWAYKLPFAIQWVWPVPLFCALCFAPESPWWLVRQDRTDDAKKALNRLSTLSLEENERMVSEMVRTNHYETAITKGTSYKDCFRGSNLRRTEICCCVWAIQTLCGSPIMGYATYFFEQAGLDTASAYALGVSQYGFGFIGTILAWVLLAHFGRRTIYLGGLVFMNTMLFVIGILASIPSTNSAIPWASSVVLLLFVFAYDMSVGPVCFALVSETSSTRLRGKTISLARNTYNLFYIIFGAATPYMLNPTALNWKGKVGFFWGGLCFLCTVWTYYRLPEPKGRTYEELDIMFEAKVDARAFKNYVVEDIPE
jgi:MFS transporter, SP family, general alpha glucoside:H+ symporter